MPVPMPAFPDKSEYEYPKKDEGVRDIGSAGAATAEAVVSLRRSGVSTLGSGSGGTVSAPGYSPAENGELLENAPTEVQISKEDADRLYQERMEEEYAKREGGA